MRQYLRREKSLFEGVCSDGRPIVVDSSEMVAACDIEGVDFQDLSFTSLGDEASSYELLDPDLWQRLIEGGDDRRETIFYKESES